MRTAGRIKLAKQSLQIELLKLQQAVKASGSGC